MPAVNTPSPTVVPTRLAADRLVHLRASGVSVLLDLRGGLLPSIVHWGADLGGIGADEAIALAVAGVAPQANNTVDEPLRLAILPEQRTGWLGRPGLSGSRDGRAWSPWFRTTELAATATAGADALASTTTIADDAFTTIDGGGSIRVAATDPEAQLDLVVTIELSAAGVLRASAALTNRGDTYRLEELSLALPVPARAGEVLDFAGRWSKERTPQRRPLTVGTHLREGRRGRTGADAALLLTVGEPGFGFASGEVWGLHVGFSGNHRHYAERSTGGEQVIGGGELFLPGEIALSTDQSYETPWVYGVYGIGLDDQAQRLHRHLRARPQHPSSPRPVTLNVWEAVYFDHDLDRLLALAETAAAIGVERFVLDDGWFRHRRNDRAGLGDWYVDDDVWPDGLTPLIDRVRALGMEFGLWFEPEMVNLDSDLARAHPEWVMQTGGRLPLPSRHQQVLNLGIPEAYAYIRDRMTDILTANDIAYIKWDHNRDLVDAGTAPGGEPGVHVQTLATYRLMDELKERFPDLEIESCSSGGARVDLGVIERTDRVWVSDCNDPLERQQMQRWTQQLLPPELLGAHVASGRSHTTRRVHDLGFRAATAFFGHFGIEWDLTKATPAELDELAAWIELYRSRRSLLHTGDLVRMDQVDPTLWVSGVVAADRSAALFSLVYVARSDTESAGRITLRGLDPERRYVVRPLTIGNPAHGYHVPPWFGVGDRAGGAQLGSDGVTPRSLVIAAGNEPEGIVLSGRALATAGVQAPQSYPEQSWLIEVTAI
ncbi:alpha-galactosidase [Leifsonia poae]|uniref:Alpha-galactosidase n=1 Tax=Leifsonia poae TaxID=110933 RepID=A0A9W6HAT4_9MICO|nr:alpha-galactosidase [Leifsonia poae]GLJ76599.1 alpha-galactosidase [Leifsonia poae]